VYSRIIKQILTNKGQGLLITAINKKID